VKGGLMEKSFRFVSYFIGFLVVALLVQDITQKKFAVLRDAQAYTSQDVMSIKVREQQLDCLAINIYREAGHEPAQGKQAVAFVTLNRTQDDRYPSDICSVVKQKTKRTCQFSWFCNKVSIKNKEVYEEAKEVAIYVYANYENLKDITKGALYYHADYVNPRWKLEKTTVIGRHIFYKESGKRNDDQNESATEGRTIKTFLSASDGGDYSYQR
jgi:spore germination cell wall hydrolase CwlJ-like protein